MIKVLKKMQNVGLYILASFIPAFISVVMNPFIAKNMSSMDYSIVGFYSSFNLLLTPLVSFYLAHFFSKRYYECSEEQRQQLKALIYRIFFIFSLGMAFLSVLGIWIYNVFFNKNSIIPLFPYVFLFVGALFFNCFYTLELSHLKMKRNAKLFFVFSMVQSVLIASTTLVLVVLLKWGALGKMLAPLIEALALASFILFRNRNLLFVNVSTAQISNVIKFCYPLVLTAMLGFFSKGFDCVLLERFNNPKEFALYTIGLQFASYLILFTNALQNTFQSDIYECIAKKNSKKLIKIGLLLLFASISVVVLFILFAPFVIEVLTYGRYTDASQYARIMSISIIFMVMFYFFSTINVAKGKTKILLVNKIIVSFFAVLVTPFFVQRYMYEGGAICQVVVWFFSLVCLLFISNFNFHRKSNV